MRSTSFAKTRRDTRREYLTSSRTSPTSTLIFWTEANCWNIKMRTLQHLSSSKVMLEISTSVYWRTRRNRTRCWFRLSNNWIRNWRLRWRRDWSTLLPRQYLTLNSKTIASSWKERWSCWEGKERRWIGVPRILSTTPRYPRDPSSLTRESDNSSK